MFTNRALTISPKMKIKLHRIDALISEGYTLNKIWGFYPDLKTSSGKSIDIYGGLFRLVGPAGFSWIAFFFPWAVCTQIREWSFFYFVAIFSLFDVILDIFIETPTSMTSFLSLLTCYWYACMFPYLRYLAANRDVDEISKTYSILIGLALCLAALIPSFIQAFVSNTVVV